MANQTEGETLDLAGLSISEMLSALDANWITSVDLVCAYLNRIAYYDRSGICLNSIPIINPEVLNQAKMSDDRRRSSGAIGPLEGVPFTVKDSYMVKGLPVAAGSPALADVIATGDAATVEQLREAGAILLGKTNMPPMAAGGVQPGVYGYSHSPYSPAYLTAAYGSGSSYGSGTATAASFAAFGMAEETLSSGRSPASNNSLVAYTPSRGLISIRGNWPLRPTCDVVVPHSCSVDDLLRILDVVVVEDSEVRGDFWRQQEAVDLPDVEDIRPASFSQLTRTRLDGVKLGVPSLYIGADEESFDLPVIRDSVRNLWDRAVTDLQALGADVIPIDFPVVANYEEDRPGALGLQAKGYVTAEWQSAESSTLTAMALEEFLQSNADPSLNSWADVDGTAVFPDAPDHTYTTKGRHVYDWQRLAEIVKAGLPASYKEIPGANRSIQGLERARKFEFEDQLTDLSLDGVIFPANGDVAQANVFQSFEAMSRAHKNGVVYSNGNRVFRHLGIPTVTVPMGSMADTKMPVGLTFAGSAYSDTKLLSFASAYERYSNRRVRPYRTPSIPSALVSPNSGPSLKATTGTINYAQLHIRAEIVSTARGWLLTIIFEKIERACGSFISSAQICQDFDFNVWADGMILPQGAQEQNTFCGEVFSSRERLDGIHVVAKAAHRTTGETIGHHVVEKLMPR